MTELVERPKRKMPSLYAIASYWYGNERGT